jgi:hypothetical protein
MLVTPEEQQLISDLFDRMRSFGVTVKDREAEVLINQSVRSFPDAPYMLVQSALCRNKRWNRHMLAFRILRKTFGRWRKSKAEHLRARGVFSEAYSAVVERPRQVPQVIDRRGDKIRVQPHRLGRLRLPLAGPCIRL